MTEIGNLNVTFGNWGIRTKSDLTRIMGPI